jgi:hypothetical protein
MPGLPRRLPIAAASPMRSSSSEVGKRAGMTTLRIPAWTISRRVAGTRLSKTPLGRPGSGIRRMVSGRWR